MITRRFEYVGNGHDKFWEVTYPSFKLEPNLTSWSCRWGRNGTRGQTKTFQCGRQAIAVYEAEDKIQEKLGKGYVEVPGSRSFRMDDAVAVFSTSEQIPGGTLADAEIRQRPKRGRAPKPAAKKPPQQSFERPKRRIQLG
jgi:predicted DNA-binding WGR domain protein